MKKVILLTLSHGMIGVFGFALGIYLLPILTAPVAPSEALMAEAMQQSIYRGVFRRDLEGSDFFHWGDGEIAIGSKFIALKGEVAPGPDYKLYLSSVYVETEAQFEREKLKMIQVGEVKTFKNFVVEVPATVDTADYSTVVIWCESFGEFISAARYR